MTSDLLAYIVVILTSNNEPNLFLMGKSQRKDDNEFEKVRLKKAVIGYGCVVAYVTVIVVMN